MRRLCDEGVRSYLGRSCLVGESPTVLPGREVMYGRPRFVKLRASSTVRKEDCSHVSGLRSGTCPRSLMESADRLLYQQSALEVP